MVKFMENSSHLKSVFSKVYYFLIISSIIKNKLQNIFQYLIMENELENDLLMFYFSQIY
jgi:hypothetical protein